MNETILVVDGEELVREIIVSMLKAGGYEFRESPNGLAALALLESGEKVDLILSELMMTELDGIGLLERVKEKWPSIPFAVVTAVHDESVAEAAISRGACDYLLKPFEREQLLATVRGALETHDESAGSREQRLTRILGEVKASRQRWEASARQIETPKVRYKWSRLPRLLARVLFNFVEDAAEAAAVAAKDLGDLFKTIIGAVITAVIGGGAILLWLVVVGLFLVVGVAVVKWAFEELSR